VFSPAASFARSTVSDTSFSSLPEAFSLGGGGDDDDGDDSEACARVIDPVDPALDFASIVSRRTVERLMRLAEMSAPPPPPKVEVVAPPRVRKFR
jgi:hypothetical protein